MLIKYMVDVAMGMHYISERGLVHRVSCVNKLLGIVCFIIPMDNSNNNEDTLVINRHFSHETSSHCWLLVCFSADTTGSGSQKCAGWDKRDLQSG